MDALINKLIGFILEFDAWNYLYANRMILAYLIFFAFTVFYIDSYLSSIFYIKKSKKKVKYIKKDYNFLQRIFLVHYHKNVYEKVDRFWFDIAYRLYLVNLILFMFIIGLSLISYFFTILNTIVGGLYVIHHIFMILIVIGFFIGTKHSPMGGVEFRDAKRYRSKK